MTYWHRARNTIAATVALGLAFLALTLLLPRLGWLDALWQVPIPSPQHWLGQVASSVAILTSPVVVYPILLGVSVWARRRQLTTLAAALTLAVALSFGSAMLVKEAVGRPRPDTPWDFLVTQLGPAYPSAHIAAVASGAVMAMTLVVAARRTAGVILVWRIVGPVTVVLISASLLVLGALRLTDVLGGVLLGALSVAVANLICDVHPPRRAVAPVDGESRAAAVVYNPTKLVDQTIFKSLVEQRLQEAGWAPPVWLSTTADDPGRAMARHAQELGVDLVLVAGGDGTVRIVCGELADTGMPVGIVPSGTGNLLARNMAIPLDAGRALTIALEGRTADVDLLRLRVPGEDETFAAVMCGVGADAALMNDTNEDLKKQIGVAAYVVAGMKHMQVNPIRTVVTIDDGDPIERDASLTMVGNVSDLQAGLTLMPEATAHDGVLDVLIASPSNQAELTQFLGAVLTQGNQPDCLDRAQGRRVRIELESEQLYELDGDVVGKATQLDFEVMPGALRLRVPA